MDATLMGAASALAGVVLAQGAALWQTRLEERRQRRAMLVAKLEELAEQLLAADHWVDAWYRSLLPASLAPAHDRSPAPLQRSDAARRVLVLALLYFPALRPQARALLDAADGLYAATLDSSMDSPRIAQLAKGFASASRALHEAIATQAARL